MRTLSSLHPHQSSAPATGCWRLAGGRAMALRPRVDSVLAVTAGQAWATLDGPHGGTPGDAGDLWLAAGDRLTVRAGQRLVLESRAPSAPVAFDWLPDTAPRAVPSRVAVGQAWDDLCAAVMASALAAGRLLAGLGLWGLHALRPRGRATRLPA